MVRQDIQESCGIVRSPFDIRFFGLVGSDIRVFDLAGLIRNLVDPEHDMSIALDNVGNLYIGCVSRATGPSLEEYFCGRLSEAEKAAMERIVPPMPENMIDSSGSLKFLNYAKRFDDGIVQFVRHGECWVSKPGYAWAVYGHVCSRQG